MPFKVNKCHSFHVLYCTLKFSNFNSWENRPSNDMLSVMNVGSQMLAHSLRMTFVLFWQHSRQTQQLAIPSIWSVTHSHYMQQWRLLEREKKDLHLSKTQCTLWLIKNRSQRVTGIHLDHCWAVICLTCGNLDLAPGIKYRRFVLSRSWRYPCLRLKQVKKKKKISPFLPCYLSIHTTY